MNTDSEKNKIAWEYRAYEFWNKRGTPNELAEEIIKDPLSRLRYHQKYFSNISKLKIANVCGSNGRIAVPLALLGADVTIFDISAENKRYAMELADCAGVNIKYEVCDFYDVRIEEYGEFFDIVYAEGGILHYFHDIEKFMNTLYSVIKPFGRLILSDFHPFRKILRTGSSMMSVKQTDGNYFDTCIYNGDVAYKSFFDESEQGEFPNCSLRFYTISEIINSLVKAGFNLREFNEHPNFENKLLPGEFTIYATK